MRANADLIVRVYDALRARHYSRFTVKAYLGWLRRFEQFHGHRDLLRMGEPEISVFLTHRAVDLEVSPSTQNQALAAILFLYVRGLHRELERLTDVVRARPVRRIPVVLDRIEVRAVLHQLDGPKWLMAMRSSSLSISGSLAPDVAGQ